MKTNYSRDNLLYSRVRFYRNMYSQWCDLTDRAVLYCVKKICEKQKFKLNLIYLHI